MISKKNQKERILYLTVILIGLLLNVIIFNLNVDQSNYINNKDSDENYNQDEDIITQGIVEDTFTKEWLDNGDFAAGVDPWYNTTVEDESDVNATYSNEAANYEIMGDSGTFQLVVDPSDPTELAKWDASKRYEYDIFPEFYGTTVNEGFYASHWWDEGDSGGQDQNTPAVRWKRNVTLPINMSDYKITSASIKAVFNATVQAITRTNGGIEVPGDSVSSGQGDTWDFARFNVEISNLVNPDLKQELAHNKTSNLGDDDVGGTWDYIYDRDMTNNMNEQLLIAILENILSSGDNQNLTIILGIDINCADNDAAYDEDNFDELLIRSLNLTFTYEKKINQLTSLSWNQVGNKISGQNVDIEDAKLSFKYKINETWPSALSPNSEIRIIINGTQYSETIKLSEANTTYGDGKIGGFDVTNLIRKNVNISLSIQVYLADAFTLDRVLKISIDNVSLLITYIVSITEDTTSLDLFLNGIDRTLEKSIEVSYGENINITVMYKNSTGGFISEASVNLTGEGLDTTLNESLTYNHYNRTINSTILGIGEHYFTINAYKRYYEPRSIPITIEVINRETDIQLFLEQQNRTDERSYDIPWNMNLNITIKYKDKELVPYKHIPNATVKLIGVGTVKNLTENKSFEQYTIMINTTILELGPTNLRVEAQKQNYSATSIRFEIDVTKRNTYLDNVFLNYTEQNNIEIQYNELLNISVTYNDTLTNNYIDGATVSLNGTLYSAELPENAYQQYSVVVNTSDLERGPNYLTISAKKDNYTRATRSITITVNDKDTYFEIFLNGTNTDDIYNFYSISIGQLLNITVKYKDSGTHNNIPSAQVDLIENRTIITSIEPNLIFDQYNLTLNATELGDGFKTFTISAFKINYRTLSEEINIWVEPRDSALHLFVNGTELSHLDYYPDNVEVWQQLNITATFEDAVDHTHHTGATIVLRDSNGTLIGTFDEIGTLFNLSLNIDVLQQEGIADLTAYADIINFKEKAILFRLRIVKRQTELTIFFNSINKTLDPITEPLPIGAQLNLTVKYTDAFGHIPLSNITLGIDYIGTLTGDPIHQQYFIIIDTNLLGIGINTISLTAYKTNYETQTENLQFQIRRINTEIDTEDGEDKIEIRPGESVKIIIELKENDADYGFIGKIKDAEVTYDWKFGDGDFDEDEDGLYVITLEDVPEGTYTIEITVFKEGGQYEFEDFEITLIVKRPAEENLLFLILFIAAVIVSVSLAGYLIAYQRILKYPKPVRKVRKYRRTLKKKNAPSVDITGRDKAFKSVYSEFIDTNLKKGKTSTEIAQSDNMVKKSLKSSIGVVTKKPVEK